MAHMLFIEPDRKLAEVYAQTFNESGHSTQVASSAQSAILAVDDQLPDVIILELQLIEHSGVEFLYELRSYPEWQTIPVVVLSNIPPNEFDSSHDLLMNELGVRAYHYKPRTSLTKLLSVVQEHVAVKA